LNINESSSIQKQFWEFRAREGALQDPNPHAAEYSMIRIDWNFLHNIGNIQVNQNKIVWA
jgi:hypothetical protein